MLVRRMDHTAARSMAQPIARGTRSCGRSKGGGLRSRCEGVSIETKSSARLPTGWVPALLLGQALHSGDSGL